MTNIEIINLIQRYSGIAGFVLITIQIFLSANRKFIKLHKLNGILAYLFIFIHPLMMVLYKYFYTSSFDPFYVYVDFCVLCDGSYEAFVNLGRAAFYILTLTVITARFRGSLSVFVGKTIGQWINNNWRYLHLLNYPVFYLVSIHAKNIGTDLALTGWFTYVFWICQVVVLSVVIKKVINYIKTKSIF